MSRVPNACSREFGIYIACPVPSGSRCTGTFPSPRCDRHRRCRGTGSFSDPRKEEEGSGDGGEQ